MILGVSGLVLCWNGGAAGIRGVCAACAADSGSTVMLCWSSTQQGMFVWEVLLCGMIFPSSGTSREDGLGLLAECPLAGALRRLVEC
jgi:hypothetical protein